MQHFGSGDASVINGWKNHNLSSKIIIQIQNKNGKIQGKFQGGETPELCPICKQADSVDTEEHSFKCGTITSNISIEGEYSELFGLRAGQKIAKTVENIEKFREEYLDK